MVPAPGVGLGPGRRARPPASGSAPGVGLGPGLRARPRASGSAPGVGLGPGLRARPRASGAGIGPSPCRPPAPAVPYAAVRRPSPPPPPRAPQIRNYSPCDCSRNGAGRKTPGEPCSGVRRLAFGSEMAELPGSGSIPAAAQNPLDALTRRTPRARSTTLTPGVFAKNQTPRRAAHGARDAARGTGRRGHGASCATERREAADFAMMGCMMKQIRRRSRAGESGGPS